MKKLLTVCFAMVIMATMLISAFAATNGFVSSPSGNAAPRIVSFTPSNPNCTANLVVVAYIDKNTLPDDARALLENAYKSIADNSDLTKICDELKNIALDNNIDSSKLAVSDLFDLSCQGCTDEHNSHYGFSIVLEADTLSNFVCLLHMNKATGVWEVVDNAKVSEDSKRLEFYVETLSPFAIVVNTAGNVKRSENDTGNNEQGTGSTEPEPQPEKTGSNILLYIGIILLIIAILIIVFVIVYKKKKNDDESNNS